MSDRIARMLAEGKITPAEAARRRKQQRDAMAPPPRQPAPRQRGAASVKVVVPNIVGLKQPRITSRGDVVSVSYSEIYLKVIPSNGETFRRVTHLLPAHFNYLDHSFSSYKRFRYKELHITWEPLTTSPNCGTIACAPCADPDPGSYDITDVMAVPGGKACAASERFTFVCPLGSFGDDWYDCRPDPIPVNPQGAPKIFMWFCSERETTVPSTIPVGVFRASYTVEFTSPIFPGTVPTGLGSRRASTVDATPPDPTPPLTDDDLERMVRSAGPTGVSRVADTLRDLGYRVEK